MSALRIPTIDVSEETERHVMISQGTSDEYVNRNLHYFNRT